MTPIKPDETRHVLPSGSEARVYAKNQPEYVPLPSLATPDGNVITEWRPDPTELALLNEGVPVTLMLYTFNRPLQPIVLVVGGVDAR